MDVDRMVKSEAVFEGETGLSWIFGMRDENIRELEDASFVQMTTRGNKVILEGPAEKVERARVFMRQLHDLRRRGVAIQPGDVAFAAAAFFRKGQDLYKVLEDLVFVVPNKKHIAPKSFNQRRYVRAVREHDLVLAIGPAGTGKTFLAMAMAVASLMNKRISRIILTRPAIEAGEKLGFLPGDLQEKIHPYLRPLYDALYQMMDAERVRRLIERGTIEVAPLAFMRGRTLDDSFVILDEGQNTTTEQMKMFLTRLGFGSKAVVTGDVTQIDLPANRTSGLVQARNVLKGVKGVETVHFGEEDVVRHKLVQRVIAAYARHDKGSSHGS